MSMQQTLKNTVLFKQGSAPSATDVVTLDGLVFVNPKVAGGEYSDIGNGQMGNTKSFVDPNMVTAEFDIVTVGRGGGAAGTAPKIAELLKSCGLAETINAGSSVSYTTGGSLASGQCQVFTDGYQRLITGAMLDLKVGGKVGEQAKFTFSVKGYTDAVATAMANPSVTLDTANPPIVSSATVFTVGGGSIPITEFEFALGNQIQSLYAVGQKQYYLQNFDPTINIKAIKVKGTEAHWSDLLAGNIKSVQIVIGSVAGQIIEIDAPYAKPKEVSESDDNGKVIYSQTLRCQSNVGNDNFTIIFK